MTQFDLTVRNGTVATATDTGRCDAGIRAAQTLGVPGCDETGPQYPFLTAQDLDRPGLEGAKWCCRPPPRDQAAQQEAWRGRANGTLSVYSSGHAPCRFDESGKLPRGGHTDSTELANGVPGHEVRMPLPYSGGYTAGGSRRTGSWRRPRPTPRGSTACARARASARSRPARTPPSAAGTPGGASRRAPRGCMTAPATGRTRHAW